jgi:hypothetical protein
LIWTPKAVRRPDFCAINVGSSEVVRLI